MLLRSLILGWAVAAAPAAAQQFAAWTYSGRIEINTTSTGANVSGNVTNFPLLVRLDANNFIFSQAHISGNDLRFEDPDGTSLSYHIERWDPTSELGEVWVKVPQVDGNSMLDYITMYWGNPAASAASSGSGVFSGYVAAWHLHENPGGGAPQFTDASGNNNHGTAQGGATGDSLTAVAAKGFKLNGSSKYVSSASTFSNPNTLTTSCWFKTTTTSGGKLVGFGNLQTGASATYDRHVWMGNDGKLSFGVYNGSSQVITSTSAYNDGRWHHAVGRLSASGIFLYVDGALANSNTGVTSGQNYTGYWRAGYDNLTSWTPSPTSSYFNGTLDEVRVAHTEVSADFIKLNYETQKQGSTVLTYPNTELSTWSYNAKLYVNTTATGARVASDVSDFPLLVRLSTANFNFSQANSDGSDLRFADSAGNLLAYEIERFDATNELAEIWVLLSTVYGNNNSQWFRMYWGKGAATSLSSANSVFRSDNGFIAHYHMAGSSGSMPDASPYANDASGNGNVPNQVDGTIGKAQDFDGNGDYFSGGTSSTMDVGTNDKVTVSAWIRRDGANVNSTAEEGILGKFEWTAGNYRCYDLAYVSGSGFKFVLSSDGSQVNETALYSTGYTLTNGTWYHVAAVADNATQKIYLNGVLVASQAYTNGIFASTSADLKVGLMDDNGTSRQFWNGVIDEASASSTNRSADWVKLSYETQKTGSTVVTFGARPGDFTNSLRLNFNTTSSGANVSGNVTSIPILVRLTSSNFTFSSTRDDGADLKFVDKDGTHLYHDVAEWDKANKTGKVWVRVPQVDGNSTTDYVTLYYGCSSCSGNPYAISDSVWSAYAGVFHLAAPESQARDAGKNGYHGTFQRNQPFMTGITASLAPIFDGTSDYIQTTAPTTAGTRTFSAWIYPRSSDNTANIESVIDGDISGQYGTGFGLDNGVFKVILDNEFWTTSKAVTLNTWQHVVVKFNSTNAVLYHNGASAATTTYTQGSISSNTLRLGRSSANAEYFDGAIQEVQMMDSYASDDYVKLSYENQKEGSLLFSTSGITTASFLSNKVFKFNTTSSGADIAGDVYNYPLLLRITGTQVLDAVESSSTPDIRFLDADGVTWLDYSVERWDNGSKDSAEVWVKVPKIDGNSASDFITMYYNSATNGTIPDGQCASCVFDASNFKAVYHLNENAASATVTDVRGAYNGTFKQTASSHNTSNHFTSGVVGTGGLNFNGTSDWIDLGSSSSIVQNVPGATISGWYKPSTFATNSRVLVFLSYNTNNTGSRIRLYTTTAGYLEGGGRATDAQSVTNPSTSTSQMSTGNWYHIASITDYANSSVAIYVNGVRTTIAAASFSAATSSNTTSAGTALGGRSDGTADFYGGIMDEVQISSIPQDTNWVKLNYQSQRRDASPLFNPSPDHFESNQKLTFNTTRTGANVMVDVEDFPLLVRITNSTIINAMQTDADDIRFLDGDGKTWLQYEVERYDRTNNLAEVWVKVPKIDGNSDQDFITMYYDDTTNNEVPDGECSSCVFPSSNGFAGVWHLGENGNTTGSGYADASGNGNHGTGTNMDASDDVTAVAGLGSDFNSAADVEYIAAGTSAGSTSAHTVSFWVNSTSLAYSSVVDKIPNDASGVGWTFKLRNDGGIYYRIGSESATGDITKASAYSAGTWVHVTGTFDGSINTGKLYINGALAASSTSITREANNSTTTLRFGTPSAAVTTEKLVGKLDEIQISSTVRDSNWIRLTYETQRSTGNLFWNSRPGPNNKAVLTATPGSSGISLSWTTPITDSSNADSIGIWVKYAGKPDSVGATGQTKVAVLPVTDSAYTYPATYPMTYYFALAVRNSSGAWSPFTAASTDTVQQSGVTTMTDTIYVDSASTITATGSSTPCTNARNPVSALKELEDAVWCAQASGFAPNDTLVIRVMPGSYTSTSDNEIVPPSTYPVVVTAFDANTRPILSSSEKRYTVQLGGATALRNMDVRAAFNGAAGIQVKADADSVVIRGCRIYNNGNTKHDTGIVIPANNNEGTLITSCVIHEPTAFGVYVLSDDRTNIIGNTFIGNGTNKGIYMPLTAFSNGYLTFTNNIFYNWDYGIQTTDGNSEVGEVSNNLFHLVTSGREVSGETDLARVVRDPMFYSTSISDRNAFKLLPGSPAIDAGTSTISTGASNAFGRISYSDLFGTSRPQGSARDIGAYEGSGYTSSPTGEFDTLTNTVSGNTVIVKNGKFKLVWDMARGGGITGFYNMSGDTTANLVGTGSLLFDARLDSYLASTQTSNTIAPTFAERTRARSVVRQRLALSASLELNVYYTVYPSGHVFIQSEISNLGTTTLDLDVVQYALKVAAADAATKSATSVSGISHRSGYGYLNLPTRDAFLSVTAKLDGDSVFSETWGQTASVAGSLDSVSFQTSDLADPAKNMTRHHSFLLYVGDLALDGNKAAALNADAFAPSVVTASSGSLLHEKSWQDYLAGHWPMDDGAGTTAKDVSITNTNNTSSLTSTTWVSGKVGGALRFTTSAVGVVSDNSVLEARKHLSVSFWFKPDFSAMGTTAFILSKGLTTASGWYFRKNSGVNTIRFNVDGASADSPVLTTGIWHHVVGSVGSSGQLYLYVDGVLVAASSSNATLTTNASDLRMGENAGGGATDRYAGDLDDVRVYEKVLSPANVQALWNRGFATKHGHYHLRADNNNRVVALLNESAAATRFQPAFEIDNWYGTKTPKYVYLNGVRLAPNVDYAVDSVVYDNIGAFGSSLYLQLNQVLTGSDQTLFVDDNDSSGYLGEAAKMKSLTIAATANDKIAIQNFSGSTFGSASSGQWALELDLNGWTTPTANRATDTGFGEFNSWKAAAISPNVAVSSAAELTGYDHESGRNISHMKFDDVGTNELYSSGEGYLSPANLTYTLTDSSSTRLSLVLTNISLSGEGTATLSKRFTVYPSGRVFASFVLSSTSIAMDQPRIDLQGRYSSSATGVWGETYAQNNARYGMMAGDLYFHSFACAVLSLKSAGTTTSTPATMINNATDAVSTSDATNYWSRNRIYLATSLFEANDDPITINYVMDISRDFTDSATADSLMKDLQTPATVTAITGTANPADALDFAAAADGFAEGDGAYVYTASSGVAHFKFVNTVAHFSPAFRIKTWNVASLPEFVVVDNQTLVRNYQYNAYVNTAADELVIQFNKTFQPGTHVFYISHKTGLAVTLNRFEAVGGEGVDTLKWTTESEFENLGFNLWRRASSVQPPPSLASREADPVAVAAAPETLYPAAAPVSAASKASAAEPDSLPSQSLSAEELEALGYIRLNPKLIPGAPGGSSASTRDYVFVDRTAAIGTAYEYLLEAVDFHGVKAQYGPRTAVPGNPLETALLPNQPNPFNPVTTLRFSLKERAKVGLYIYDARGRLVRTLLRPDRALPAGKYRMLWDARDDRGYEMPSGQYFYRFTAARFSKTRKMLLVK